MVIQMEVVKKPKFNSQIATSSHQNCRFWENAFYSGRHCNAELQKYHTFLDGHAECHRGYHEMSVFCSLYFCALFVDWNWLA